MHTKTKSPNQASAKAANPTAASERFSAHYRQLEQALARIEAAQTHYQALNINRLATSAQISQAYRQALAIIHPFYPPGSARPADETQKRVKQALQRVALAASVLLSFDKRKDYDRLLPLHEGISPAPATDQLNKGRANAASASVSARKEPEQNQGALARDPQAIVSPDEMSLNLVATQRPTGRILIEKKDSDRRRGLRFKISIPVFVTGHDRDKGKWQENAKAVDVNRFGVAIQMRARPRQGMVIHLRLPLPAKLRMHGYTDPTYNVYAIVRRVQLPKNGLRVVAVEFLGEHPPAGYLQQPWNHFRTTKWEGSDRRREPRIVCTKSVRIEYLDQEKKPIRHEIAITEDISRSGMRVLARMIPPEFDLVRVTTMDKSWSSVAALCNRFVGADGIERLCLNFLEAKWPL